MTLLIENATVVTFDHEARVFERGAVLIDSEGRIAELGEGVVAPAEAPRYDAGGRMLIPGLINAHHHLYSTLARGFAPAGPTRSFPEILSSLWWPLDAALELEDVRVSAELALLASLRCGVTTVVDHHASLGAVSGSLDAIADAAATVGLRISTCFEISDRAGAEVAAAGIAENVRFAKRCAAPGRRLAGLPAEAALFGLHASMTLSDATLKSAVEAANDQGLARFHVHVAEDLSDVVDSHRRCGRGPAHRLIEAGALGPGSLAIHGVHLSEAERRALAAHQVFTVVNPSSNMNNAVGRSDAAATLSAGVRCGLGSDGMHADIQRELSFLAFSERAAHGDPTRGGDLCHALFLEGNQAIADSLFPGARLGRLERGGSADLVILDAPPFTPVTPGNALYHLIYGQLGGRVSTVFVGGEMRLKDGLPTCGIDEPALRSEAQRRAKALWARCRGETHAP